MNQSEFRRRYVEIDSRRGGGLLTWVAAVLSSIVVLVLAVLFSALFLGLFIAIAIGVAVRAWLIGRNARSSQPQVIDADYTVVDPGDSPGRGDRP